MSIKLFCKNTNSHIEIEGGTTLAEIAESLGGALPRRPICCRVNNKTESLDFRVFMPKTVEFQDCTTGSGPRVYIRSLCMMLYRAVREVLPGANLYMEHSLSHGYYCRIINCDTPREDYVQALKEKMQELHRDDLPIVSHTAPTQEVIKLFREQGLTSKVQLLRTLRELYTKYVTLDGVVDSYYGALAPSTGHIGVFDLLPYKEGFLLMSFDPADPSRPSQYVNQEKMYEAFSRYVQFNFITGVSNVGELNTCVLEHRAPELINVTEALHEKALTNISDDIRDRYDNGGARIVLISGPSSSGKTTTTKRLAIQLMTNLLKPKMISLDNYFVDREHTPRDINGDYDYESLYALDLDRFNKDLEALLAGKEVEMPTYNFETGCREYKGDRMTLEEGDILLIEGIHGLNPDLTPLIPEEQKYRIYVSALTTLHIDSHNWVPTTDNRLLRRIIRDYKYRGTSAEETIRRWPSVRRGEEKWIFPYQENADAMFNSSLVFELAVMRDHAENVLRSVPGDVPEYAEAYRLRKFLSYFLPIDLSYVPSNSLLREFMGGSLFKY